MACPKAHLLNSTFSTMHRTSITQVITLVSRTLLSTIQQHVKTIENLMNFVLQNMLYRVHAHVGAQHHSYLEVSFCMSSSIILLEVPN